MRFFHHPKVAAALSSMGACDCKPRSRVGQSARDGEKPPGAGHAIALILTMIDELDARADYEVLERAGDEDFIRKLKGTHPSCDVNGPSPLTS